MVGTQRANENPRFRRILLVDDARAVRHALRGLLESRTTWEVCGEAADGREAVQKARELSPDMIIMDLSMPVMDGLEATRQIRSLFPEMPVLMVTQYESEHARKAAVDAGVNGFVSKGRAAAELRAAVESVFEKGSYFTPQ